MSAILVVSPHALDEVLGCGGTMALHANAGDQVETLILFGDGTSSDAQRRIAAPAAASILGSCMPRFAGFPENHSDTLPLLQIVRVVEQAIAEIKPRTIYVPHGGNLNIDHHIAFRAAVTAARPVPQNPVKEIYSYEVLSSTEWAPLALGQYYVPNRFVDITQFLERKMRALECYAVEMKPSPHARSAEGVRALATSRGHTVGVAVAEAFAVIRQIVN